jgi:hypothetical protein
VAAADAIGGARAGGQTQARAWLWATIGLSAGAFALAIALAPPASASPSAALSGTGLGWLLFVASSGHVAATGWFYGEREVRAHVARHRGRYLWTPLILVLTAAVTAAILPPRDMAWLLLPYFAWQFFHFQKQNLGVAALAASSAGAPALTRGERRAIMAAGWAGIAGLMARPSLLQVTVDPHLSALFPACTAAFGLAVALGVALLARRPAAGRPTPLALTYLMGLLFFLPVFVFASPYAAVGSLTIAHGAQYLLLMGLVAGGGPVGGTARALRITVAVNIMLIGGAALEVTSHLHDGEPAVRVLYGMYLGVVMAHFVIDAGLWRLRDAFPRRFLAARVPYLLRPTIDRQAI